MTNPLSADLRLNDMEQTQLYEYCRSDPDMYSLVRRLAVHGLAKDFPYHDDPPTSKLRVYPDWMMLAAQGTLDVIESDFGQSGRDVRLEAIRCQLWDAHERGLRQPVETNEQPVAWRYKVNGCYREFSSERPPDDAYDEGTLEALYARRAEKAIDSTRMEPNPLSSNPTGE